MKRVALIGANGKSGQAFVRAALEHGYVVRAGIHNANALAPHERLEVVKIDSTKPEDIKRLIAGCDAVVSLIGHGKRTPDNLLATTMEALVSEMPKANIRKLVSLTGTGVRFNGDHVTFGDRVIHLLLKVVMPKVLKDGRAHAEVLKKSDLEWTIIRGLVLTTGQRKNLKLTAHGPAAFLCPRENIASGIVEILESDTWSNTAPVISR